MEVLLFAVPVALLISLLAVLAFIYQVKSGQFDDLETPPLRMLFDDVEAQKNTPRKSSEDSLDDSSGDSSHDSSDDSPVDSSDDSPVDPSDDSSAYSP